MREQMEFLYADGPAPELHFAHPLDDLLRDIEAKWHLPVGRSVRVFLRDPALPIVEGRLDVARAPDLPLNVREPLALRIGGLAFTSRDIASWSLLA